MRVIETADAPAHSGPAPQAVAAGGWIFVAALFGTHPASGQLPDDADEGIEQPFVAELAAAGASFHDAVRVGVFTKNLQRDRPSLNKAWVRHFGDHRPARSAVEVADLGRAGEGAPYVLEVTAYPG